MRRAPSRGTPLPRSPGRRCRAFLSKGGAQLGVAARVVNPMQENRETVFKEHRGLDLAQLGEMPVETGSGLPAWRLFRRRASNALLYLRGDPRRTRADARMVLVKFDELTGGLAVGHQLLAAYRGRRGVPAPLERRGVDSTPVAPALDRSPAARRLTLVPPSRGPFCRPLDARAAGAGILGLRLPPGRAGGGTGGRGGR